MTEDTGDVLRRSLDSVDRHRKQMIGGLAATVVALAVAFVVGAHATQTRGSAVQAFLAHFAMLLIWMTALTFIVVIQIAAMTKRILRAIELASTK